MKKAIWTVLVMTVLTAVFAAAVSAAEPEKISDDFLTDGILLPPVENYMKVYEFNGMSHQVAREYTTQSEDIMKMIGEWENLGEEAFLNKYGFKPSGITVQHDCKLDEGEWHYEPSWDEGVYDYSVLPDYMCLYPITPAFDNRKILTSGYNIDLYYMEDDGSNWGFFSDVVVWKDTDSGNFRALDLENHTLYFRSRYYVDFYTYDAEGTETEHRMFSDWCPETSVGKNGTQEEYKNPVKLEAPIISNMELYGIGESNLYWNVFWEIPESVYSAVKYFWIIADYFEPVTVEGQYRINGGEWIEVTVANAGDVYGGNRGFYSEGTKENDTVEFRARFYCNEDESKTSDWSDIVTNKAADTVSYDTAPADTQNTGDELQSEPSVKTKCKVCGICPVQPLGICLFIWIAVILIAVIITAVIVSKNNKKNKKE